MTGLIDHKDIFTVVDGEIHHLKNVDNVLNTIDDAQIWPYAPRHNQPPFNLLKNFLTDVGSVRLTRFWTLSLMTVSSFDMFDGLDLQKKTTLGNP